MSIFADDDRRTDSAFVMVVVGRNHWVGQEGEQVLAVTSNSFEPTVRLCVFPRCSDQFVQTSVQALATRRIALDRQFGLSLFQPQRIADQSPQFLGEF